MVLVWSGRDACFEGDGEVETGGEMERWRDGGMEGGGEVDVGGETERWRERK